jgi:hypothetical protein
MIMTLVVELDTDNILEVLVTEIFFLNNLILGVGMFIVFVGELRY